MNSGALNGSRRRKEPFHTDRERVEYLFALYEKLAAPLAAPAKKPRKTKP